MTEFWVPGYLFWLFVKNGENLDPNFGKIIYGNICDHDEDTLVIILSRISGLWDHKFPFYKALSDGMQGFGAPILTFFSKIGNLCNLILGRNSGNIRYHNEHAQKVF